MASKPLALALDFKKFTPYVLETGKFLVKNIYKDSSLILFHIIEHILTPPAYLLPYLNIEKELIDQELDKFVQELHKDGIEAEKKILLGEFWTVLRHFVKTYCPELIIVGYEPHSLKVPTAERILERLEWSFLVIKDKPLIKLEKILCPFDFSESSYVALKYSSLFARVTSAQLLILHIISPPEAWGKSEISESFIHREKEVRELWEATVKEELLQGIKYDFEIVQGDSMQEILNVLLERNIDLIIMGRRGKMLKSGIGAITRAIIKTSPKPILLATLEK